MLGGRLCQLPISNPRIFPCCRFIEIVDVVTRKMLEEYEAFKYRVAKKSLDRISVISGFHHFWVITQRVAAIFNNILGQPTSHIFRVPESFKNHCPKTSVRNYRYLQCNNAEQCSSHMPGS